jgi:glycosyltransferase involved in cell wall biosynthesis
MRGSEAALLTLLRGLDRREVVPFLFTSNEGLAQLAEVSGVETIVHPMPEIMIDGSYVRLQVRLWAQTVQRMASFIASNNIQLLYCNGGSTCQVGYYAGKARSIPVICHLHSPYNRRYILFYRFHRASEVIFVSKAIQKRILGKQEFLGDSQVVYNGVDTVRFEPAKERNPTWRQRLSIPERAVVFGQVSSIISRKGIDVLLRAFQLVQRRYPDSRLVLVGDGPDETEFVKLSEQLGTSKNVVWTGNQTNTLPYYQHVFDVSVLASRSDAFPLSVLEAAACGLPNIGANVDGIPESILDGKTGFLFEREDHEMLAEKMSVLIRDPELRKRLGQAGRQVAMEQFSMGRYCADIQEIILKQADKSVSLRKRRS